MTLLPRLRSVVIVLCLGLVRCSGSPAPAALPPAATLPVETSNVEEPKPVDQAAPAAAPIASTPTTAESETPPADASNPPDPHLLRPLRASAYTNELTQLGLDPVALPPLSELPAMQKFEVMTWIAKSLGVECTHCHVSDADYRAETQRKAIARKMWDEFVVGHRVEGEALFCDSCHQGAPLILDRERPRETKAYMKQQFGRISDHRDAALECSSCHGKPFEKEIFERVWAGER